MFSKIFCSVVLMGFALVLTSCVSLLPQTPSIAIGVNNTLGVAPFSVSFQTALTMPKTDGKDEWTFAWDFGDGASASDADIVHTYDVPGKYRATLSVSNDDGFSTERAIMIHVLTAPKFETAMLPTGLNPVAAQAIDLNQDQRQDLVVANADSHTISVFVFDEDKFSTSPYQYPAIKAPSPNPQPQYITVGDINHDTIQDLVVLNPPDDNVTIMFGNGIGGFQTPSGYNITNPKKALVGDFNGDYKRDVLVLTKHGSVDRLVLMEGRGTGELMLGSIIFEHTSLSDMVQADFDNDGLTDLAISTTSFGVEYILLHNNGHGFDAPVIGYLDGKPLHLQTMDFNFDRHMDLVTLNKDGSISMLQGDGTGRLSEYTTIHSGLSQPTKLLCADLNGDHLKDLVVEYNGNGEPQIAVLLGNGLGEFTDPILLEDFAGYRAPISTDLDGDLADDLILVNPSTNELLFGLSRSQP